MLFLFIALTTGCNILSLSGGGAHGSFQAGVLNQLHNKGKQWDIITGVSVGSLNGIMLGMFSFDNQHTAIKTIKDVWLNITTNDVYRWNWDPFYDQSFLDNSPLNKTITNLAYQYGGVAKRDIIIGSTNLNTGLLRLFNQTDFDSPTRTTDIVMASSSIPVVFPPRFLDNNYYVDGGVFSNEIIRPAIKYCLNKNKSNITIDIIICSPPVTLINNAEIKNDHTYGLAFRAYDIAASALSNHEIYTSCNNDKTSYPMYIYKPTKPYSGSLLDFSHSTLNKTFYQGYNTGPPLHAKYCY